MLAGLLPQKQTYETSPSLTWISAVRCLKIKLKVFGLKNKTAKSLVRIYPLFMLLFVAFSLKTSLGKLSIQEAIMCVEGWNENPILFRPYIWKFNLTRLAIPCFQTALRFKKGKKASDKIKTKYFIISFRSVFNIKGLWSFSFSHISFNKHQ